MWIRAEETAQLGKCFLCKREDLSSDLGHPGERLGTVVCVSAAEVETGGSLGSLASQLGLMDKLQVPV